MTWRAISARPHRRIFSRDEASLCSNSCRQGLRCVLLCLKLMFIELQGGAHKVSIDRPHPPFQVNRPSFRALRSFIMASSSLMLIWLC